MADDISPYEADTQFTEREVLTSALRLVQRSADDNEYQYEPATVKVAAEWDRKGHPQHSPLDYQNPSYRTSPNTDDLIITIEVKIDGYTRSRDEQVQQLEGAVRGIISKREEARLAAQIAEATGAAAAAKAALDAAERRLATLRAK